MSGHPNARALVLRDAALAAAVGAINGSDFGAEDDYGSEFGDDYGAESPAAIQRVPDAHAAAAWRKQQMARHRGGLSPRHSLLDPNRGQSTKVEKYSLNLTQSLVLGTASTFNIQQSPDTNFRPQRVTCNAPVPGFGYLGEVRVGNVAVTQGGLEDAFNYSAHANGSELDLPTLTPSMRLSVLGQYSGLTPAGYTATQAYLFNINFKGWASVTA